MTSSHNRITNLPGETDLETNKIAKRTLVVGIRKTLKFDQSKPSAEYAIPIAILKRGRRKSLDLKQPAHQILWVWSI
jgi:hypothetical protein